jgi:hypothetical protein
MRCLVLSCLLSASAASVADRGPSDWMARLGAVADCGSVDCPPEFLTNRGSVLFSQEPRPDDGSSCCPAPR